MSWNAKTLNVSRTGRSLPNGQTYRKAGSRVKYPKGRTAGHVPDRPLGMELACHPQALTPTPIHPGCVTSKSQYHVAQWAHVDWAGFHRGAGLWDAPEDGDWRVVEPITGEVIGWDTCSRVLSYRNAAARAGATLEVYDD